MQKYNALIIISTINKVFGWLTIVGGLLASVVVLFSKEPLGGVLVLIASGFFGLILLASGEIIHVIIDIESNTRAAASVARKSESESLQARKQDVSAMAYKKKFFDNGALAGNLDANDGGGRSIDTKVDFSVKPVELDPDQFEAVRLEALQAISKKGYIVEAVGEYPNISWRIKKDFALVKETSSIDVLVKFAHSL